MFVEDVYIFIRIGSWDQKMPTSFEKIQQDWKSIHYQIILLVQIEQACSSKFLQKFREGKIFFYHRLFVFCTILVLRKDLSDSSNRVVQIK